MKRNIELLKEIRNLISREPSKLDMGIWAAVNDVIDFGDGIYAKVTCGTTACVAGWAVQLAGDKLLVQRDDRKEGAYQAHFSVAKNGKRCDIEDRAQGLLGLTVEEKDVLFFCDTADEALAHLDTLISGGNIDYDDYDEDYYGDD